MRLLILLFWMLPMVIKAQDRYPYRDLKSGRLPDTSYVYELPIEPGKRVWLVQGYESHFSHKGEVALDFKLKKGTRICAARAGWVETLRKDSDEGGLKPGNLADGNFIAIRHTDGSIAYYWHLQKEGALVNIGDTVYAGQVIGLSGNTGYSAFPHLHFEVQAYNSQGLFSQIPTRFNLGKRIAYLRPGRFYKRPD